MKKVSLLLLAISWVVFAENNTPVKETYKTYLTIEKISENTQFEMKLPHEKEAIKNPEIGKRFEIPFQQTVTDRFSITLKMDDGKKSILPCQISIEQLTQYDRRYICTAQNENHTQVELRVFTNLHGGDKIIPKEMVAKK